MLHSSFLYTYLVEPEAPYLDIVYNPTIGRVVNVSVACYIYSR